MNQLKGRKSSAVIGIIINILIFILITLLLWIIYTWTKFFDIIIFKYILITAYLCIGVYLLKDNIFILADVLGKNIEQAEIEVEKTDEGRYWYLYSAFKVRDINTYQVLHLRSYLQIFKLKKDTCYRILYYKKSCILLSMTVIYT